MKGEMGNGKWERGEGERSARVLADGQQRTLPRWEMREGPQAE